MTTKKFKCTLLSDIILNENTATQGSQQTLDYIPGSVFLGLVAGQLYLQIGSDLSMDLFHNAKVRFGDAYPLDNYKKAIRIPASWQVIKGENIKEKKVYLDHALPEGGLTNDKKQPITLKQCREGFVVKDVENHFKVIESDKNFAIKSAYNPAKRRSMDKQMYGYQSLEAGVELCFQVDFDAKVEALVQKVVDSLIGKRNIGRSKTAQYGQVNIEVHDFAESFTEGVSLIPDCTFLYAESRLAFLDDFGQPTAHPTGEQLGIPGALIDLFKSQIRTFRYAPYNFKRQSRDADRYVIEKGSVICLNRSISDDEIANIKTGLGLYKNEGFGRVLINPEFLKIKSESNIGESLFQHISITPQKKAERKESKDIVLPETLSGNAVLKYLIRSLKEEEEGQKSYKLVNDFVEKHKNLFLSQGEQFSSQWSTIRLKATQNRDKEKLRMTLFGTKEENKGLATSKIIKPVIIKKITQPGILTEVGISAKEGYLVSGIAASKWEGKRIREFEKFFNNTETTVKTIINLAAEMAKVCKRKGGNHENK